MQSLRCTRLLARTRCFGTTAATRQAAVPWFVDPTPIPEAFGQRPLPPHLQPNSAAGAPPLPEDAPEVIKYLHAQLLQSPHLEKSGLVVSPAVLPAPGPPLPFAKPHGRRKRGGTYAGESGYDATGGEIWSWVVMGQVWLLSISQ